MRNFDFSSWGGLLSTLIGLVVITLVGVGIRILVMQTIQQRRARENRQINERLRTLIAAYKTLGGSFTGNLTVDPRHKRDLQRAVSVGPDPMASGDGFPPASATPLAGEGDAPYSSDRTRRVRDAVEAALSDIILLGTAEQVELAAKAASELAAGHPVQTDALVISLRDFIRHVLDLEPVPEPLQIPRQGPTRAVSARSKGEGNARGEGKSGEGGGGEGGGGGGAGAGAVLGGLHLPERELDSGR